jgi:aromatic ring-opening dioxygenase catalytic subunit (LigB family)
MKQKQDNPLPTFYISHGGGPCFWMDWGPTEPFKNLADYFRKFSKHLNATPDAILVISAHWEEEDFTIQTNPSPPMLFDYYGFPADTYKLNYPAKTSAGLISRVQELFTAANVPLKTDSARGYDHGLFVPFLLMYPNADIPVVQLSLKQNLDPLEHIEMGKILEPLRSENILIVGSGLSYHNLRQLNDVHGYSKKFDDWLMQTSQQTPNKRAEDLIEWENAPHARLCHPREDHLIPLMVVTGAAKNDSATRVYHEQMSNWKFWTSSFRFG